MPRLPPPPIRPSRPLPPGGFARALASGGAAIVGAVLTLVGLLLVIGTLLVGGAALLGWLLWARWQGKPAPNVVWRRAGGGGAVPRGRTAADDDVIDVPSREVPAPAPRDAA
jgi:hypothetical protein